MNYEFPAGDPRYWHWPLPEEEPMATKPLTPEDITTMLDAIENLTLEIEEVHEQCMDLLQEREDLRNQLKDAILQPQAVKDAMDRANAALPESLSFPADPPPRLVSQRRFASRTDPEVTYTTTLWDSGDITCTCKGFEYRKTCRHCDEIKY